MIPQGYPIYCNVIDHDDDDPYAYGPCLVVGWEPIDDGADHPAPIPYLAEMDARSGPPSLPQFNRVEYIWYATEQAARDHLPQVKAWIEKED